MIFEAQENNCLKCFRELSRFLTNSLCLTVGGPLRVQHVRYVYQVINYYLISFTGMLTLRKSCVDCSVSYYHDYINDNKIFKFREMSEDKKFFSKSPKYYFETKLLQMVTHNLYNLFIFIFASYLSFSLQ
jgi:hypothetical protein